MSQPQGVPRDLQMLVRPGNSLWVAPEQSLFSEAGMYRRNQKLNWNTVLVKELFIKLSVSCCTSDA